MGEEFENALSSVYLQSCFIIYQTGQQNKVIFSHALSLMKSTTVNKAKYLEK